MRLKHLINKEKFKRETKGFTLIEIIIAIALISVIGVSSVVGINYAKNKSEERKIDKIYSQFDNALDIYLADHPEILKNLEDNVEGAVVTLEVLKNEGLVKDGVKDINNETIDYKNTYYVLSDAVLLSDGTGGDDTCKGQVELNVLKSWKELSDKTDTAEVIYVCPKGESEEENEKIKEYEDRISRLESQINKINIGNGTKNYVLFDVSSDTSKNAYWPETNTDLWRILSNENGEIKILYTQPVIGNHDAEWAPLYSGEKKSFASSSSYYYYCSGKSCTKRLTGDYYDVDIGSYTFCQSSSIVDPIYHVEDNTIYFKGSNTWEKEPIDSYDYNGIDGNCSSSYWYSKQFCYQYRYAYGLDNFSDSAVYRYNTVANKYLRISGGETGWRVDDLFSSNLSYEKDGSKRNSLYNAINSNLKTYINEVNISDGNFKDKIGVVTEAESKKEWLSNKSFVVGLSTVWDNSNLTSATQFKIAYGGVVNLSTRTITDYSSSGDYNCYYYNTTNYTPTLSLKSGTLLTNLSEYSESYKTKYNCTQENLGTETCPMLIKFSNYYSNGERVN